MNTRLWTVPGATIDYFVKMQSNHRREPSSVVCRYSKKAGGCRNINCEYRHPLLREKRERGHKRNEEDDSKNLRGVKRRRIYSKDKEEVILIPDGFVGKLLGTHGCRIKDVKEHCRAYINVSDHGDVVEDDKRIIYIKGTASDINEAKEALYNSLIDVGIDYIPLKPVENKPIQIGIEESEQDFHIEHEMSRIYEKELEDYREKHQAFFHLERDHKQVKSDLEVKTTELEQSNQVINETNVQIIELKAKIGEHLITLENERDTFHNQKENCVKLKQENDVKNSELENSKQMIKELSEKLNNCENQNKIYFNELNKFSMERDAFKEQVETLKQKQKTAMLSKDIQIGKKEKELQSQIKINENMEIEINEKNTNFEAQRKALKAEEQAHENAKKCQTVSDEQLSQMKEEMLLNQENLERSLNEIKLRDLTVQQYLQCLNKIKQGKSFQKGR